MKAHLIAILSVLPLALPCGAQVSLAGADPSPLRRLSLGELAGRSLGEYPHFSFDCAFNEGTPVELGLDTKRLPLLADRAVRVHVVKHRSPEEWEDNPFLSDVRGGPTTVHTTAGGVAENRFVLDDGLLTGHTGTTEVGVGYDVVLDLDADGRLGPTDLLDGGDEAGFYVMPDLTRPGPHATVEFLYNGGSFRRQDIYWPAGDWPGPLPLVVVSHGNGHNYRWYDHIGHFLASWGYVVMSHENNTGPGINAAASTTLANTNHFLAHLDSIAGGALRGRVDSHRIVWIGHSRGGEGVVRAYERLRAGDSRARRYGPEDIVLVSSIAPTVFLNSAPGPAPYHLWTGGADADVNGCADCDVCQTFRLHDRAPGERLSIYLHGAGHGDFHDGGGGSIAAGPCLIGRARTHQIMRGTLLALVKHYVEGNVPCKDYLWRQWEDLRPIGAPTDPCVVVDHMYQPAPASKKFVLDDFQLHPEPEVSAAGAPVFHDLDYYHEGRLDDNDARFTPTITDLMNGMVMAGPGDGSRGVSFQWSEEDRFLAFSIPEDAADVSEYRYLSFRACQMTRHLQTRVEFGDLTFRVELVDALGRTSMLSIGAFGGGIEEPYQRGGCGIRLGWSNEFETVRIRLEDFRAMGRPLSLQQLAAVVFHFGPSHGSPRGRIGLDEIEFTRD